MSSSCLASITSALTPPSPPGPSLQEQLLAPRDAATSRRETIRQLREHADALQRELDAVTDETEAAEVATRHAEGRAREAAAELVAFERSGEMQEEKLRELEVELREKDGRIKLLEAIVATLAKK